MVSLLVMTQNLDDNTSLLQKKKMKTFLELPHKHCMLFVKCKRKVALLFLMPFNFF